MSVTTVKTAWDVETVMMAVNIAGACALIFGFLGAFLLGILSPTPELKRADVSSLSLKPLCLNVQPLRVGGGESDCSDVLAMSKVFEWRSERQ